MGESEIGRVPSSNAGTARAQTNQNTLEGVLDGPSAVARDGGQSPGTSIASSHREATRAAYLSEMQFLDERQRIQDEADRMEVKRRQKQDQLEREHKQQQEQQEIERQKQEAEHQRKQDQLEVECQQRQDQLNLDN